MTNVSEELLAHVNDPKIPDKARLLRTRRLAAELALGIADRTTGERMLRSLNDAYLNLQLATVAGDPGMLAQCRKDCIALIGEIRQQSIGTDQAASA
ncbi:hypothetical protein [Pararhizobium haloflavum]|uniref:hypothetical protein n=1 Tax=Pararhizobium haloflavum TaxID=2037914 RepID=UPI000C191E95|nr:hypothetical protein [Pararhizobium haloflavum]